MLPCDFTNFSQLFYAPSVFTLLAASFGVAAALFFASARFLLIAQQTGYKPRALTKWFLAPANNYKNRLMLLSLMSFLSFCLVGACFIPAIGETASSFIGFICFILFAVLYIKTESGVNAKIPLKKTGRLVRLSVTYFIVLFAACFALSVAANYIAYLVGDDIVCVLRYCVLTFTPMLIPYAVAAAEFIAGPFENRRNARFIKRAARTLEQSRAVKIGITGSFGKTGVKEILKTVLGVRHKVLATPESYNTPLGIALTVKDGADADFFIAEMGARRAGDIKELCDMVKPSVGVLTGVNGQHLETFGSAENIKKTKFELFDNLYGDKIAVFSNDNDGAKELYGKFVGNKCLAGVNGGLVRAENVVLSENGAEFTLLIDGEKPINCKTRLLGIHNVSNFCLAAAAAYRLGSTAADIAEGALRCEPAPHRLNKIQAAGGGIIIDDSYNSSVDGAKAALAFLSVLSGKKTVFTPGLVELGAEQYAANFQLGKDIAEIADRAVIVGKTNADALTAGLAAGGADKEKIILAETLSDGVALAGGVNKGEIALFLNDLPDCYD